MLYHVLPDMTLVFNMVVAPVDLTLYL